MAGTRITRTIVASTSTAVARPTPNIFTIGWGPSTNPANTQIMMSAADVMTRAVDEMPLMTDVRLSRPSRCSSRMRDSRKTS